MKDSAKCEICGANLIPIDKKEMNGTRYIILRCEKCRKQTIRRDE